MFSDVRCVLCFFFKQKTAYEIRISDCSSDVCSSDLDTFLSTRNPEMALRQKMWQLNWGMMLLLSLIAGIGFAMLYSAASGSFDPWASRQMVRFEIGRASCRERVC